MIDIFWRNWIYNSRIISCKTELSCYFCTIDSPTFFQILVRKFFKKCRFTTSLLTKNENEFVRIKIAFSAIVIHKSEDQKSKRNQEDHHQ